MTNLQQIFKEKNNEAKHLIIKGIDNSIAKYDKTLVHAVSSSKNMVE